MRLNNINNIINIAEFRFPRPDFSTNYEIPTTPLPSPEFINIPEIYAPIYGTYIIDDKIHFSWENLGVEKYTLSFLGFRYEWHVFLFSSN